jgi:hypothetical protein
MKVAGCRHGGRGRLRPGSGVYESLWGVPIAKGSGPADPIRGVFPDRGKKQAAEHGLPGLISEGVFGRFLLAPAQPGSVHRRRGNELEHLDDLDHSAAPAIEFEVPANLNLEPRPGPVFEQLVIFVVS